MSQFKDLKARQEGMLKRAKATPAPRFTVYALADPRTGKVCYVGITTYLKHRIEAHRSQAKRSPKGLLYVWLGALLGEGLLPIVMVLALTDDVSQESAHINRLLAAGHPIAQR